MKKTLVIAGVASAVGLAGIGGTAMAASSNSTGGDSLVSKIAQKFNLKEADVKAVFDQNKADHQAQRNAEVKTRLDKAVTDGKINKDQEAKIIAKLKEMQADREANHDSMKGKTSAERKAEMDAYKAELVKWASDNGIPAHFLRMGGGHRGPGGRGEFRD